MIVAAVIWLLIAAALIVFLWPDIWFTASELDDQWAAFVLIGLAVLWPLSVATLIYAIIRDYLKARAKC